jgi:hypothetical protein
MPHPVEGPRLRKIPTAFSRVSTFGSIATHLDLMNSSAKISVCMAKESAIEVFLVFLLFDPEQNCQFLLLFQQICDSQVQLTQACLEVLIQAMNKSLV